MFLLPMDSGPCERQEIELFNTWINCHIDHFSTVKRLNILWGFKSMMSLSFFAFRNCRSIWTWKLLMTSEFIVKALLVGASHMC